MVITAAVSKPKNQQNNQERIDTMEEDGSPPGSRSSSPSKSIKTKKPIENGGVSATVCANCGTTTTPLWRRAPNGDTICNACGLYMKARNAVRPHWLKRNTPKKSSCSSEATGTCPGDGHCNGTGGSKSCSGCPTFNQHQINRQSLICANCNTTTTPLWRRDEAGATICNACGLYYKLHGRHRPVSMKRSVIKRRKRMANGSGHPDDRDNSDEEDSEDDKSIGEHYSESAGSVPASPKEAPVPKEKVNSSKSTHTLHKDHHDHDPNSCNHDQCRQNATRAGYVPALEDYGKPVPKKSLKSSDLKRMPNKLLGRESEHKPKRKQRRTSEQQGPKSNQIISKDVSNKNGSQWASTETQASNCSDSEVPLGHSNQHISPQSQSTARSEYQTASMLSQKEPQSLPISPHSMKHGTPPIPPSSSSPSLFPPIRDTRSESPHVRLTSSPHIPASPSPSQRPNPPNSHDFTLPPIYEQHPHLPPISMGSMPSNISDPMSYQPSHGYSNPSMNGPVSQPNHQPIRYSPNPQPSSTEYYNSGTPNQHPVHQSPSPRTLPSGEVQGSSGSNITKEDLEAHRMELQREVSHLSILLSKTTAMLAGLDQAVTSKEPSRPDIRASVPSREQTTSGPPSYWDGSSNGYQPMQQPNPNYRNHYYPPNGGAVGYAPTYHNVDEYSKRESSRYPEGLMQSQYYPPQYPNVPPPQQPQYDPRSQPPYHYGNPQLPPLYPSPPPPPPSDGVNQPSQTIRY